MLELTCFETSTLPCGIEYVIYQNGAKPFGINKGEVFIARFTGETPLSLPPGATDQLAQKASDFAENYAFAPGRHHIINCKPRGEHPFFMIVLPKEGDTFTL